MKLRTIVTSVSMLALTLAFTACGGGGGASDDPNVVAEGVLKAYKAQDIGGIMNFLPEEVKKRGTPPKDRIFIEGHWRTETTKAWDGKLGEVRIEGDAARVKYGEKDGETFVVGLIKKDGKWYFKKLYSPSNDGFNAWGKKQ